MILDKKQMTGEDVKLQYITPAIESKWGLGRITKETKYISNTTAILGGAE